MPSAALLSRTRPWQIVDDVAWTAAIVRSWRCHLLPRCFAIQMARLEHKLQVGLDTGSVELTIKTLLSHLITRKFNSPTHPLRTPCVCVEP